MYYRIIETLNKYATCEHVFSITSDKKSKKRTKFTTVFV